MINLAFLTDYISFLNLVLIILDLPILFFTFIVSNLDFLDICWLFSFFCVVAFLVFKVEEKVLE